MIEPSQTVANGNGRDRRGRFGPGNKAALGNPFAKKIQRIRAELFAAIKAGDIRKAVEELVRQAKAGDRFALVELLDRTLGKAAPGDVLERIEQLEKAFTERLDDERESTIDGA